MRYRLLIEYDGTSFSGWQTQPGGGSVQDAVGEAVRAFCGARVLPSGAGRTDAGVHARGQVAHVDLESAPPADRLRDGVNFHLKPLPVAVVRADPVDGAFHARFSALRRHYRYRIVVRRPPLVLDAGRAWRVPRELDAAAMGNAARELVGEHDFTTFRASECQARSPIRTLDILTVARDGERIEVVASAPSFLHRQVRSIVGALKLVGAGPWSRRDLACARDARDRRACAPVAPAAGLTLWEVDYPDTFPATAPSPEPPEK